jgi:hypothetical protein
VIERENKTKMENKMSTNFEKLSKDVKENLNEDGYWQTILDLGYGEWNREGTEVKSYEEMLEWVAEKYGNFAVFAILAGKYNHQVCNGGHLQYFDNGYASNGGGCFNKHSEDIYLHTEMVGFMKDFGLDTATPLSKKVFEIMNEFKVELDDEMYTEEDCYECGGMGYVDNPDFDYDAEDSDEEETIECDSCGGSGREEVDNPEYGHPYTYEWDSLDTRYYDVCDEWEKYLENFVKSKLS